MKRNILIFLILTGIYFLMCSAPVPNTPAHQGRKLYFESKFINKKTYFLVYVPQNTDGPIPVLYLLNGNGQDPYGWQTGADLQNGADSYNMIIVSLASINQAYEDIPGTDLMYESYVLEIVEIVDRLYDTKASRNFRGIGGYSMGGIGAVNVGSNNPDKFISVSSMSGGFYPSTPPAWESFRNQFLYFDCGRDDGQLEVNRLLHQTLLNYNIPHFYYEFSGGHTYGYMLEHFEGHLNFHSEVFNLN